MEETWKDIKGYEGLYQVSDRGNVKSIFYKRTRNEIILKQCNHFNGYYQVCLCFKKKRKTHLVHRLVCNAFLDNPENKKTVNHKNGNKTDNRLENLEWNTYSENETHSYRILGKKNHMLGKSHINHFSKPILRYTIHGVYIDEFLGTHEAFKATGIHRGNINQCCKGKRNHAGGFIWKYKE